MHRCFDVVGLRKTVTTDSGASKQILSVSRLQVPAGRLVAVLGRSGAGKTTLFNLLGGLDSPDAGSVLKIRIPGSSAETDFSTKKRLKRYPRSAISYVFQAGYLLPRATVGLNVALSRLAGGLTSKRSDVAPYIDRIQLHEQGSNGLSMGARAYHLSGGEQQRVGIARALARAPTIIFADEPTSSLDPSLGDQMIDWLKEWIADAPADHPRTVLWVTHNYHQAADKADCYYILRKNSGCDGGVLHELHADGWPIAFRDKRDPEMLRQLVYDARNPPASRVFFPLRPSDEGPTAPARPSGSCGGSSRRGSRLFETMFAGVRWAWLEMFEKRAGWPAPVRLIAGYRKWLSTFIYATMLVSLFSGLVVQTLLNEYFVKELNSPNLRHVVVSDNIYRKDTQLDEKNLANWNAERPWTNSCVSSSPGAAGTAYDTPAFGRLTVSAQLTPDGDASRNREHPVSILVAAPSEPLLRGIPVYGLDGSPAKQSLSELFEAADGPGIILERSYLAALKKEFALDLPLLNEVDIWLSRGYDKVRLLGVVDHIPYDRAHTHNAMMSQRNYALWLSQSAPDKLVDGTQLAQGFERVVFYFSPGDFDCIFRFLLAREFDFNRDNFEKFGDLVRLADKFSTLVDLIVVFSFGVIGFVVGLTTGKIITENQSGLAVLVAHGAGLSTLLPFVTTLIINQWLIAAVCFYALLFIALWASGPALALFGIEPLSILLSASVLSLIGRAVALSIILGAGIVIAWTCANWNMAAKLREG